MCFFIGENVIELAMYLDLLNSHLFPAWPAVFAIADRSLEVVKLADPDFYNHLKAISRINVKVNPKVNELTFVSECNNDHLLWDV